MHNNELRDNDMALQTYNRISKMTVSKASKFKHCIDFKPVIKPPVYYVNVTPKVITRNLLSLSRIYVLIASIYTEYGVMGATVTTP